VRYRSVHTIEPDHIGHRVTVRRKLDDGQLSDVIGVLEDVDAASVTVRTHHGDRHTIVRSDIAAARVHEAPTPRNPPNPAPG
jgi:ribosome maturation factor RimP